ncbi:IPT/TIG domain-containing protein [Hymenobacter sp. BT770]|uniref:IPT/TIG domain-containing protein n=1 Tax=Hymenobacter sp. BT770 TaxID=2886942 RepID=UPI001D11C3CD|nr:IPT/TIG domain-containing protein [Hymenobacter sp. BT770]MCC3155373.1 T9SS type A sorting domain-containing protein [Hymenobacter sp. BT770]MDO3417399.1 IPT/TIG domain-containing protein [Hymenobacter sp. BT770]
MKHFSFSNANGRLGNRINQFAAALGLMVAVSSAQAADLGSVTSVKASIHAAALRGVTAIPTITSFTPTSGTGGAVGTGTLVTITGTDFTGATAVKLNGVAATSFAVVDAQTITFTVPATATNGTISVTTPDGTATSTGIFYLPPTLSTSSGLTPNARVAGGPDITLTIKGTNFTPASTVNFNGVSYTQTSSTATSLVVTIPSTALATAGSFPVTVTSAGGTSNSLTFIVSNPSTAGAFENIEKGTKGGYAVDTVGLASGTWTFSDALIGTLSADKFNGLKSARIRAGFIRMDFDKPTGAGVVTVNAALYGSDAPTNFILEKSTDGGATFTTVPGAPAALTATLTPYTFTVNQVGNVRFRISNTTTTVIAPATSLPRINVDDISITNFALAPTIASFTPTSAAAGTTVTVTGTDFTGATTLTLNGVAVTGFTVVNATTLTFVVPVGATSGTLAVTTPFGTATSTGTLTFIADNPAPTIASITPATAVAGSGALTLTVNGTNFISGSVVNFNGTALTTTYMSATQLTAAVPATAVATAGTFNVSVTNAAPGGGTSANATFSVTVPAPTITSFTPTSGLAAATVTITGTDFTGATAVTLNGVAITGYTVVDAQTITFAVPATATSGVIAVTTPTGTATSTTSFTVIAPNPVATITTLAPATAIAGATAQTLTVNGTNFLATSVVNFDGAALTTTYVSATQLTAALPATALATAGAFNVTVTNPAPGGGTSAAATFTVTVPAPTIASFTPASALPGTLVTVTGTDFTGATAVTLNGVAITGFTVVNATSLTFTVPAAATSGAIAVTTPTGTATSTTTFTVLVPNPVPTITGITPATTVAGSAAFTLTVDGTNFITGSTVNFNGVALTTTYVSATQLTAAVPASAVATAGSYLVTVTNAAPGGGTTAGFTFTVTVPAPTIASFTPITGGPTTTVTITGTNFTGATAVTIGSFAVTSFTVDSPTSITLVLPTGTGSVSGFIAVVTPGGTATSTATFNLVSATLASKNLPGLSVYPNPFQDRVTVALPGSGAAQVALRDLTGRVVVPMAALAADKQLLLPSSLAAGSYLLEVRQGNVTAVRRIQKQ